MGTEAGRAVVEEEQKEILRAKDGLGKGRGAFEKLAESRRKRWASGGG